MSDSVYAHAGARGAISKSLRLQSLDSDQYGVEAKRYSEGAWLLSIIV